MSTNPYKSASRILDAAGAGTSVPHFEAVGDLLVDLGRTTSVTSEVALESTAVAVAAKAAARRTRFALLRSTRSIFVLAAAAVGVFTLVAVLQAGRASVVDSVGDGSRAFDDRGTEQVTQFVDEDQAADSQTAANQADAASVEQLVGDHGIETPFEGDETAVEARTRWTNESPGVTPAPTSVVSTTVLPDSSGSPGDSSTTETEPSATTVSTVVPTVVSTVVPTTAPQPVEEPGDVLGNNGNENGKGVGNGKGNQSNDNSSGGDGMPPSG